MSYVYELSQNTIKIFFIDRGLRVFVHNLQKGIHKIGSHGFKMYSENYLTLSNEFLIMPNSFILSVYFLQYFYSIHCDA